MRSLWLILCVVCFVIVQLIFNSVDWPFLKELKVLQVTPFLIGFIFVAGYYVQHRLVPLWFKFPPIPPPDVDCLLHREKIVNVIAKTIKLGRNVLVEGPSGSGKSILCQHYANILSKTRPVLFYTIQGSDFEMKLLNNITGPIFAPLFLWWSNIAGKSLVSIWLEVVLFAKKSPLKPIIFIDAIHNIAIHEKNDGKNRLLKSLFDLSRTEEIQFVLITSNHGAHIIHNDPIYPLQSFFTLTVGQLSHEEAIEYLDLLKVPTDEHEQVLAICGYLIEHLSHTYFATEKGKKLIDYEYLKSSVVSDCRDRLKRSGLSVYNNSLINLVKDIRSAQNMEISLEILQQHFSSNEEMDAIIRGNALYISSDDTVSFQSASIMNYVLSKMKITNGNSEATQ